MKIPVEVRCTPVFHKVWRYRVRDNKNKISWSKLYDIWICTQCKLWSAYKSTFTDVCSRKDRRKRDRRKAA
jgi:uncharacterized protein (DUF2225 family)